MKVALIDFAPAGHHAPYAREIARGLEQAGHNTCAVGAAEWCESLSDCAESVPIEWTYRPSANYFERQAQRRDFFRLALRACRGAGVDVAHLLYVDGSFGSLVRTGFPRARDIAVVATLHWYPFLGLSLRQPKQALKGLLTVAGLWWLDQSAATLTVHSIAAQKWLRRVGIRRVHALDYPSDVTRNAADDQARQRYRAGLGVLNDSSLLLCFGGTRYDKGVDLAIEALAAASPKTQLLVAGAEQDFDRRALLALASKHRVESKLLLRLGRVPDNEVAELFGAADAVLLPYRPIFKGQSGPLTIAGSLGVPVIAADVPVLAETVTRFGLGRLFRAGDVNALSAALCEEWPRIDAAKLDCFADACNPGRFAMCNVAIYEHLHLPRRRPDGPQELAR